MRAPADTDESGGNGRASLPASPSRELICAFPTKPRGDTRPSTGWTAGAIFLLLAAFAAPAEPSDLRLKAEAFLNLPRYVEWPSSVFVLPNTSLNIAVYGHPQFYREVVAALDGRTIKGRHVLVRHYHWPQTPNAHIVFIAPSERHRLPRILRKIQHTSILTVSDCEDFVLKGGMVRMSMEEDKVRFQVQVTVVEEAGLKFSSTFLAVTDEVVSRP